jgi:hypothetical protein
MSIQDDKALMRQWGETFNPGKLGAARELITGDFAAHVGSSAESVDWDRYRQLGELLLQAFPDGHISLALNNQDIVRFFVLTTSCAL